MIGSGYIIRPLNAIQTIRIYRAYIVLILLSETWTMMRKEEETNGRCPARDPASGSDGRYQHITKNIEIALQTGLRVHRDADHFEPPTLTIWPHTMIPD